MFSALAACRMTETSLSVFGTTMRAGWAVQAAFMTFLLSSKPWLEGVRT